MTYIPLNKININTYGRLESQKMKQYFLWILEHGGVKGEDWNWRAGDIYAQGVYFKSEEIALMFKLANDV